MDVHSACAVPTPRSPLRSRVLFPSAKRRLNPILVALLTSQDAPGPLGDEGRWGTGPKLKAKQPSQYGFLRLWLRVARSFSSLLFGADLEARRGSVTYLTETCFLRMRVATLSLSDQVSARSVCCGRQSVVAAVVG